MRTVLRILAWLIGGVLLLAVGGCLSVQRPEIPFEVLEGRYATPASRYLDLPGGLHVHYRDQGAPNGPVLVMVHGFGSSLETWEPWVAELGADYRIITLDLPGHGLTRAPRAYRNTPDAFSDVIDAVATRLGVTQPYVVIGNSMGGGAAWNLALRRPERVRALVLVDSVGLASPDGQPQRGVPAFMPILVNPPVRWLWQNANMHGAFRTGLRRAYGASALVTEQLIDRYTDLSRAPGHRDNILNGASPGKLTTPEMFAAIRAPTLVLHGEADQIVPVGSGRALAAAIPGAVLITYPGVGHVPMELIPAKSAADVRRFLEALPPQAAPPSRPQ